MDDLEEPPPRWETITRTHGYRDIMVLDESSALYKQAWESRNGIFLPFRYATIKTLRYDSHITERAFKALLGKGAITHPWYRESDGAILGYAPPVKGKASIYFASPEIFTSRSSGWLARHHASTRRSLESLVLLDGKGHVVSPPD